MIKKVLVGDEKYKVLIGKNKIFKRLSSLEQYQRIIKYLLLPHKNIPTAYIELIKKSIPSNKVIDLHKIKPGEESKSFANFQMILNKLAKKRL